MIRIFSIESSQQPAHMQKASSLRAQWMVVLRVDTTLCGDMEYKTHSRGDVRHRWNRSTYGFIPMFDQLYTHRVQLLTVYGKDLFSLLWWKVDDEAAQRGHTSMASAKMAHKMFAEGQLCMPHEIDMRELIKEFSGREEEVAKIRDQHGLPSQNNVSKTVHSSSGRYDRDDK